MNARVSKAKNGSTSEEQEDREEEEGEREAAHFGKEKKTADQRTSEDGLSAETSRTRQGDFDKRETLRIKVVISKIRFSDT